MPSHFRAGDSFSDEVKYRKDQTDIIWWQRRQFVYLPVIERLSSCQ